MIRWHGVSAHDGTQSLSTLPSLGPPFPLGGPFFAPAFTLERMSADHLPQSSSSSRFTAGCFGFLLLRATAPSLLRWYNVIPACGDIDSCALVPCQSKTPISHWTAGCFCDGCLGGGAGSMSSGSPSFSIISAISASQARAIAAQLFARTKLGEDGAENFRHLAKRRRHCGRGVGPSFGFPRARKTVVFTRLSDCYSFHM